MIVSAVRVLLAALFTAAMAVVMTLTALLTRSEQAYFSLARFFAHTVLSLCGVDLVVEGAERVDFKQNHVLVANHASMFDIPAVLAGIPGNVRIVYKKELERIPIFGWGLRYGGMYIAIDRGRRQEAVHGLETAAARIARGGSVLMFGEGTRTSDGKLHEFKRGAFNLAVRAGVPVVPLTINGSFRIMPKGSLRIHPGTITLIVEHPVPLRNSNGRDAELEVRDEVHAAIERHYIDQ
jgi:1-acyl-sn-glycerol-3-phosphate acyltransferase